MATHNVGISRQPVEGKRDNNVVLMDPVIEERRAPRKVSADRYRLKAPTFTGKEVEQLIQEFSDVMEVTQWPPRVALLKLRMSLMDRAKPCELGLEIDRQHLCFSAGPFWHLRHRRPGPTTKTAA